MRQLPERPPPPESAPEPAPEATPANLRPEDLGIGQLFELVPDAVIVADSDTDRIVLWNPSAERMFGWKASEAIGQPVGIIVPPHLRGRHEAGMQRFHDTGHGPILDGTGAVLLPGLHKAGHRIMVELTLAPVKAGETLRYVIAILRDATARIAAEEAQHEANRHKDEFLNVISHELRTPLNFIMGFGSILEDEVAGALNDQQHVYLQKMMTGSERMLTLINDLLDFAKIQAGRLQLDITSTEFAPLVEEVAEALRPLAERKGVAVASRLAWEGRVRADGVRVVQVLTNLVGNAIKFTPEGGEITIEARREGDAVKVEIADTGVGIGSADLERVFEKFQQVDMSATRRAGGTGLGLSISRALVEAMGGQIGVESQLGKGSTFWFTLPAADVAT